ncbi:MAG: SIMPL domain-containing protein [Bacillota bacterium]
MERKWFIAIAGVVGAILLFSVISLVLSAVSLGHSSAGDPDTLTVYGQGRVSAAPDIAYVTLGFENSARSPQVAQENNAVAVGQIKAAVREAGVAEADIADVQYNIYQEYYYSDLPEDQSYRVSSVFTITVRDVSRIADVISAACREGANISYGITYDLADRQKAYGEALELARVRADEKAAEMAAALGRSVKGIVQVTENATVSGDCWGMGGSGTALADFVGSDTGGALQISAVITVTYRLD